MRKVVSVEVGGEWRSCNGPSRLQEGAGGVWSFAGGLS